MLLPSVAYEVPGNHLCYDDAYWAAPVDEPSPGGFASKVKIIDMDTVSTVRGSGWVNHQVKKTFNKTERLYFAPIRYRGRY